MRGITRVAFLSASLLLAGIVGAACDGTLPDVQETGLAKPPVEQETAPGEEALVRLSSALQVFELVGPAEHIGGEEWTVAGVSFATGQGTEIEGELSAGDWVKVEIALQANGQLFAREIQRAISAGTPQGVGELEFIGTADAIGDTEWTVNGLTLLLAPGTDLKPGMQIGDLVKVHASIGEDGALTAREIEPAEDELEDSQERVGEFEFTGTVESMDPTRLVVGGRTIDLAPGTEIQSTIGVGSPVRIHALPQADGTLLAREIELADTDDQEDEAASGDADEDFKFFGIVEAIADGSWTIGGMNFSVTSSTEIDSHILVGDMVRVELIRNADGSLTAKEIEEDNDGMSVDDDMDGNDDDSGPDSSDDDDEDDDDSSGSDDGDEDAGDDSSDSGGGDD